MKTAIAREWVAEQGEATKRTAEHDRDGKHLGRCAQEHETVHRDGEREADECDEGGGVAEAQVPML